MQEYTTFTKHRPFDMKGVIAKLTHTKDKLENFIKIIPEIGEAFSRCYWVNFYEDNQIIAECKTREDFAPIRALHRDLWKKTPRENMMVYKAIVRGIPISVTVGELPPSCKLIERKKIVPEHVVTEYEMVCK